MILRANGERLKLELERAEEQEQRSSNTSRQLGFQNNEVGHFKKSCSMFLKC